MMTKRLIRITTGILLALLLFQTGVAQAVASYLQAHVASHSADHADPAGHHDSTNHSPDDHGDELSSIEESGETELVQFRPPMRGIGFAGGYAPGHFYLPSVDLSDEPPPPRVTA